MSEEPTTQPEDQDQAQEQEQAAMPEMRAEDALRFAIGLFADLAWIKLGIRANPSGGEAKTDLEQAKLAIDSLAALVQLTEGRFEAHDVRDLKNLLSSLQMNFVQRKTAEG